MLVLKRKGNNNNLENLEFVELCLIVEIYEAKKKIMSVENQKAF